MKNTWPLLTHSAPCVSFFLKNEISFEKKRRCRRRRTRRPSAVPVWSWRALVATEIFPADAPGKCTCDNPFFFSNLKISNFGKKIARLNFVQFIWFPTVHGYWAVGRCLRNTRQYVYFFFLNPGRLLFLQEKQQERCDQKVASPFSFSHSIRKRNTFLRWIGQVRDLSFIPHDDNSPGNMSTIHNMRPGVGNWQWRVQL